MRLTFFSNGGTSPQRRKHGIRGFKLLLLGKEAKGGERQWLYLVKLYLGTVNGETIRRQSVF